MDPRGGFEPPYTESESAVLPLDDRGLTGAQDTTRFSQLLRELLAEPETGPEQEPDGGPGQGRTETEGRGQLPGDRRPGETQGEPQQ